MPSAKSVAKKQFYLVTMSTGTDVPLADAPIIVRRAQLFGASATSETALPTANASAVLIGVYGRGEANGRIVASLPAYDGSLANSLTFDGAADDPIDLSRYYGVGATGTKVLILCDV